MQRFVVAISSLAVGAVLVGCGGGGGGSVSSDDAGSTLYGGAGTSTGVTDTYKAHIGVGGDGTLCGTIFDTTAKTSSNLGGVVSTTTGEITQGSMQFFDTKGNSLGIAALTGQLTGLTATGAAPTVIGATLTYTFQGASATFTFNTLENCTASVIAARRKRRRKPVDVKPPDN